MTAQIGFLHTTALSDKMKENFINGLQSTGKWPTGTFTIEASNKEGKYGHDAGGSKLTDLDKAAKDYGDRGFDLIAAAGLAAVIAAHKDGRVNTVGLIGRLPKNGEPGWDAINGSGTNVKCIQNMDTAAHNMERRDKLAGPPFNVPVSDIALMVNSNSAMGMNEHDEWVAGGGTGLKYPDLAGKKDNDHAHFGAFFRNVPAHIKGIIVSSDPFFFRFRTRFIKGADSARPKAADLKFCFPFAEWKFQDDGTTVLQPWDDARHIGFCGTGIDLLPSYRKLGICALNTLP
jgi:hypothetical protein